MEDTKSCSTLIEQWMDIHGLKYNELFCIDIPDFETTYSCYINTEGLFCLAGTGEIEGGYLDNNLFFRILNDKSNFYIISKPPYIPTDNDEFYYVNTNLMPASCPSMDRLHIVFDRQMRNMLVAIGNCYRTEQDAHNDREKWRNRMENLDAVRKNRRF